MFFPRQIKLFADGAIISQLMQMKDGYLDGHHGEWIDAPDELEERARLYWNAGYQLHIHVNGDLGLEVVLDILEKLMAREPARRPPLGHRALRQLDRGAGRRASPGSAPSSAPTPITRWASPTSTARSAWARSAPTRWCARPRC